MSSYCMGVVTIHQALAIQRKVISMPPDHGAALVAKILSDAELRKLWVNELDAMRNRMIDLRRLFSKELLVQGSEVMAAQLTIFRVWPPQFWMFYNFSL